MRPSSKPKFADEVFATPHEKCNKSSIKNSESKISFKKDNCKFSTNNGKQNPTYKGIRIPTFNKTDNQNMIKSAIINVCLAGEINRKRREEALEDFKVVPKGRNVIVLFKDSSGARQDIKAIYLYNEEAEVGEFLYGAKDSPMILGRTMINEYYRYDSGLKKFRVIQGNKNFSIAVDAVTLKMSIKKRPNGIK